MKLGYATQYGCVAVVVEPGDTHDAVVELARDLGAVYEDEPGHVSLVVDFQDEPDRMVGPELYTEDAFRRSPIKDRR